ncbi:MAG: DUF3043 domain-containing protein [Mycobacteriaceae bacterium]
MKLLSRLRNSASSPSSADSPSKNASAKDAMPITEEMKTLGKGRPTPKRREAQSRRRGPVAPAPMTAAEARARRKSLKGAKASKEERKLAAAQRRSTAADRRARMMAGEDKYLLPRDKGPVRAYVRNIVDSRRNLVGLFMPMALILIFATVALPQIAALVTLAMLFVMILMAAEGFYLGRLVNKRVLERFPDTTDGGFRLGWYAFIRASQLRKMRAPAPQSKAGDAV